MEKMYVHKIVRNVSEMGLEAEMDYLGSEGWQIFQVEKGKVIQGKYDPHELTAYTLYCRKKIIAM